MNSQEFSQKVFKKEIKNGTIYNVKKDDEILGQVGVIRTVIVNLDGKDFPADMLVGDYYFEDVEGE